MYEKRCCKVSSLTYFVVIYYLRGITSEHISPVIALYAVPATGSLLWKAFTGSSMGKSHARLLFPSSHLLALRFSCVTPEIPAPETGLAQWIGKAKLYLPGIESTASVVLDCRHWSGPSQLASCSAPAQGPVLSSWHHSGRGKKSNMSSQSHCWQKTRRYKS